VETLILALSAAGVSVIGLVGFVATNAYVREAVVKRLITRLNGKQLITIQDLKKHEIFVKINKVLVNGVHNHFAMNVIDDDEKKNLFSSFIKITLESFKESCQRITEYNNLNADEQDLKLIILEELDKRNKYFQESFVDKLKETSNHLDAINKVVNKIQNWKTTELNIINNNVLDVLSNGRFTTIEYKLDLVFNLYMLGIDFLLKNGADSFNKLNGEFKNLIK
jgi:hypothetical protein